MMTQFLTKRAVWLLGVGLIGLVLSSCTLSQSDPVAVLMSDIVTGSAPLTVGFNLSFSNHPLGKALSFELDFGDGSEPVKGIEFGIILHHTYEAGGTYTASLTVYDEDGRMATDTLLFTVDEVGPTEGVEVGNTAPDFEAHTTDGGTMRLSDYRGSVIILDFWGSWCTPCKNSMPHLDDLATRYGSQGLVVITVSTDLDEQDTINFLTSRGLTQFVSVWEPGGKHGNPVDLLYDVTSYPSTFVLDRQGVIRIISIGYPGTITDDMLEALL